MKHQRFKAVLTATAAVITGLGLDTTAASATSKHDGVSAVADSTADSTRIVFSRFVDLNFSASGIVIADPNGHHLRELTHPVTNTLEHFAQLSPDGTRIVFQREPPTATLRSSSWDPTAAASGLRPGCVAPCAVDIQPTWTPDGQHIVFERSQNHSTRTPVRSSEDPLWQSDLAGHHVRGYPKQVSSPTSMRVRQTSLPPATSFRAARMADHQSAVFRMNNGPLTYAN
jgi:Tol biopolymer transport system component